MKTRRHHNTKGLTQCKRGTPAKRTKRLAKKLGIPFSHRTEDYPSFAPNSLPYLVGE